MPQTIAKLYASQDAAAAVVQELRDHGFSAGDIHLITQSGPPETAPTDTANDTVLASILDTGVEPAHASIYAEQVRKGGSLVTILPHFGLGMTATSILESHDPVSVDLPEPAPVIPGAGRDPAAPLSSALGWRVLSSDPTPLSTYLKWRLLKPEPKSSPTLEKIRKQSTDRTPLSNKIGMKVLSDNPTPLSTKFGWRLLLQKAAPLSEKFGWRLLSPEPTPLSSKFGWRLLSDDPAPLSTKFGWRLLSQNPTPLSTALGWRVLKD